MKKLNPKKVFIIADGSYREITPAEHEFRKEADAGYREKKFIGLHSMIMEVSEKEYIEFYRNKRRQKYLDEQRRDTMTGNQAGEGTVERQFIAFYHVTDENYIRFCVGLPKDDSSASYAALDAAMDTLIENLKKAA